jgi:hypothetical protein
MGLASEQEEGQGQATANQHASLAMLRHSNITPGLICCS